MTVYAILPVFNRVEMTKRMLECLHLQILGEPLRLVVVDDGSTDGTAAFLASVDDLTVLRGDGSLWWGGAVDLAMRHVLATGQPNDWALLINNDTTINPDFVQALVDVARRYPRSVVGSVVRHHIDQRLLSVGPVIDSQRLTVHDVDELHQIQLGEGRVCAVDALSGRGVLIPIAGLLKAGSMRPRALPHYLADYELSLRLKARGWTLLVALDVSVYSTDHFGSEYRAVSKLEKYCSVRSPFYLPALITFWWEVSSWPRRLTLPLRLLLFAIFPELRKK